MLARVLLVLAAVAIMATTPWATAARPETCTTAGSTVTRSAHARVWRVGEASEMLYRACWLTKPRRVIKLGAPVTGVPAPQGVSKVRLAGRFVAFEDWWCDRHFDCAAGVEVVDLRRGKTIWSSDALAGRVVRLVLTPEPLAAWTIRSSSGIRVVAATSRTATVLAEGQGIDAHSLAVAGHRVYWMQDDSPRVRTVP